MLCAIIRCQDDIIHRSTRFKSSLLHSNELDIDNNHLSTNSEYFPLQFEKTRSKKKSLLKINKLRSVSEPLCSRSVDPDSDDNIVQQLFTYEGSVNPGYDGDENNIPQQSKFCTKEDMRTYPLMDDGKYIPIVRWKLTKNNSHIISDISIPSQTSHSDFNQRFQLDTNSPSMLEKDIGLLYRLIEKPLLSCKVTRPDISACVSYTIRRTESSTKYHKDEQLKVDMLFMKTIQLHV